MNTVTNPFPLVPPPEALRNLPGWLIWRYESGSENAKPRKVPYYGTGGKRRGAPGGASDRKRLVTFDAAQDAATRLGFDGVGLALLPDFGIVALDFDRCVDTSGKVLPEVETLVNGTYAEVSPSGKGVHAFFLGELEDRKDPAGTPFGFEVFSTTGYVTFTGRALRDKASPVAPLSEEVRSLYDARFGQRKRPGDAVNDPLMTYDPPAGLALDDLRKLLDALPVEAADTYQSSTGPSWIGVGMAIHHETGGSQEGFALWDVWSTKSKDKYPGTEDLLRKWESFGQGGRQSVTARSLIKWAGENGVRLDAATNFDALDAPTDGKPLHFDQVEADDFSEGAAPSWIIKTVLPQSDLVVLFGESGSGKSFVALDLCMAVARGAPWRGHRTKQGRVVYIAAEGGGGFRKRLKAYAAHHGLSLKGVPMGIIHATPNFLIRQDAADVAKSVKAKDPTSLIVVDTLAQTTPGANENSSDDMGLVLAHFKALHRATGATVVLVHHAGKDTSKGARGWSGLRAAADAEIEVVKSPGGRMVRITKQKDGDDLGAWGFDLHVVNLGMDEDGDPITSCVAVEAELPVVDVSGAGGVVRVGKWEKLALKVVGEIALGQTSGIEVDHVVAEMVKRAPPVEEGKRDKRKYHALRAVMALCEGDEAPWFLQDGCLEVL